MTLSLSQAVADVRQSLNEPNAVFWKDSEIEDWIKEGVRLVASKTRSIEADDDLTLVTNQLTYTSVDELWIEDCLAAYAGIYDDGANKYKGLIFSSPKQLGNVQTFTSGAPKYYAFHNRTFYIWPLPTSTENGNTISMLYSKESEDITDLSDEFQHLPIIWGLAKAYEKDRLFAQAGALKTNFFSDIQFERQDKMTRPAEGARAVKSGVPTDARG